jgi:hypothetical protein
MSDYSKSTNFTTKDTLPTGNSGKIVKGTELDTEFTAISSAIASKADVSSPALLGTPTSPTAVAGTNTTQIATTAFATAAAAAAFPVGGIVMWSGLISAVPTGWYFCNGSNGTPDLRDRFIIGASADNGGVAKTNVTASYTQTGGSKDSVLISHTHTATSVVTDPTHFHTTTNWTNTGFISGASNTATTQQGGSGFSTNSASTGITVATTNASAGSGAGTNENLPPYYALAFIMKA